MNTMYKRPAYYRKAIIKPMRRNPSAIQRFSYWMHRNGALFTGILKWIWLAATPFVWRAATSARGGGSLGAEIFWPFIPALIKIIVITMRDMIVTCFKDIND